MMRYYTALGRYELRTNEQGLQQPVLKAGRREYEPTVNEMLLWSMLLWKIREPRELRKSFEEKLAEMHSWEEYSFEYYLNRLEKLGFLRSGTGYTAVDALYALVSPLYLIPVEPGIGAKILAFIKMIFVRGIPIWQALRVFSRQQLSQKEQAVLGLITQNDLSTAELICCVDQGLTNVRHDETILDNLYDDPAVSCDELPGAARVSCQMIPILQAVTDLYLRRMIVFEMY